MYKKIKKHKFLSIIFFIAIISCAFLGYKKFIKKEDLVKYVLAQVQKGAITVSVSASGQVSASNQIDIKAKSSGDILDIKIEKGQEIKAGDLLMQIDSRDARKAVRDAQLAYDIANTDLQKFISPADELDILKAENAVKAAKSSLEKLLEPADEFSLQQARNNLDDAERNLENLKISHEREYQDSLLDIEKAKQDLAAAYENAYDSIANIFLELPAITTKLKDILFSYDIAKSDYTVPFFSENSTVLLNTVFGDDRYNLESFINIAKNNYESAREKFDKNLIIYKGASRYSEAEIIGALLDETSETMKAVSDTVKSEMNMLDFWVDCRSGGEQKIYGKISEYQNDLKAQTSKTANFLSNISSQIRSIESAKESGKNTEQNFSDFERNRSIEIEKAEWSIKEKEEALANLLKGADARDIESAEIALKEKESALEKLKAGADSLDIRSKRNSAQQKADALADARQALADCSVRAPFDGIAADIKVKKGDSVSSGNVLLTFIGKQKIVEVSLNEIDAAKIRLGQKAVINFDAADELSVAGEVAEIDSLGTANQGVSSFNAKIIFDIEDERIKPGMSAAVSIITDVKQNILMVPNSAVKSSGEKSYVEISGEEISSEILSSLSAGISLKSLPIQKTVEIGISNDSYTEISSGLKEGDFAIVRSISSANTSQSSSQTQGSNIFQMGGTNRNSSGTFRIR